LTISTAPSRPTKKASGVADHLEQTGSNRAAPPSSAWSGGWAASLFRRRAFGLAVIASLLAALYWGVIASDRYVSEARVVVQRTDLTSGDGLNLGSLLGSPGSASQQDQLLLRDHLLSVDMLNKVEARLNLRAHYSDARRDPISRMWFEDASLEWFHRHYLSRVRVEFDDYSGVLSIRAQAFDPKSAHAVAAMLVEEGERFMNALAHNRAREQVAFLEKEVTEMNRRVVHARQTVLEFQNREGLVSPQGTAENFVAIVNRLENELTDLTTRRAAMLAYLTPRSPSVVELNQQVAAVKKQIAKEKARLTSPNSKTLNRTVEQYQRLQMNAEFAMDVYRTALAALEMGRVEATRTLKKVSVLQSPFEPQYPVEPRRLYNILIFILGALLIAGTMHLLGAIIRDHQD
jgi:capsular polysaccharide transport system permease protein